MPEIPNQKSPANEDPPPDNEPALGETVRSITSLLLFIHICILFVCLTTSFASSTLQQRLLDVFRPFTQSLNFDLEGARLYLTHASEYDVDHRIEVLSEDTAQWAPLSRGGPGSERLHRYQRLADMLALFQEDEAATALIAEAIAGSYLHADGRAIQQIRCRQHTLQSWEAIDSQVPEERDPNSATYFATAYRADVLRQSDDEIRILKRTQASLEAAPNRRAGGKAPPRNEPEGGDARSVPVEVP